jgi:hypothetical protein
MVKTDVIIIATAPLAAARPETCRSRGIPHCLIDNKMIMRLVLSVPATDFSTAAAEMIEILIPSPRSAISNFIRSS